MKIPKTIKIGWRHYKVEQGEHKSCSSGGDLYGEVHYEKDSIWLYQEQTEENKNVTLLHEMMHAIFYMTGQRVHREDEELITLVTENLYQIIKDNPEMFEKGE